MLIEPTVFIAFLVASSAVVVTPGPDTMLIIRYTMSSGPRVGLATVAGVQLGLMVHTLLAILGITVIIISSPTLFQAVAVAGAMYLAWLGAQGLFQGTRSGGAAAELSNNGLIVSARKAWRDAMLCNILNPKVIILFLALIPNFISLEDGSTNAQLVILGAVLIFINIVWQVGLVLAADRARVWLGSPRVQRGVAIGTGAIFIFFAAAMLWAHVVNN